MPLAISAIFFLLLGVPCFIHCFFLNYWTPLALSDFCFYTSGRCLTSLAFSTIVSDCWTPLVLYAIFFFKLLNAPLSRSSILKFLTLVRPLPYPHFWTSLLFLQFLFIYFFFKLRPSTDVLYVQVRNYRKSHYLTKILHDVIDTY